MRSRFWLLIVCLFGIGFTGCGSDKPEEESRGPLVGGSELDSYIRDGFLVAIKARPSEIAKSPLLAPLPMDEVFAEAIEEVGIDGREIEEVLVLLGPPTGEKLEDMPRALPELAVLVRLPEPADVDLLVEKLLAPPPWSDDAGKEVEKVEYEGKTYYDSPSSHKPFFHVSDDKRTLIMAQPEAVMKKLLDEPGDAPALAHELVELGDHDVAVVALTDSDEKRKQLMAAAQAMMPTKYKEEKWEESKKGSPPEVEMIQDPLPPQVKSMLEKLNSLHAYADLSGDTLVNVKVDLTDEESAKQMNEMVGGVVGMGRMMAPDLIPDAAEEFAGGDPVATEEMAQKMTGIVKETFNSISAEASGTTFTINIARPDYFDDLPELIEEGMAQAEKAAKKNAEINNLRQIGLAIRNYELRRGSFPTDIVAEDGTPLLSWRVRILPYLEEQVLYDQFRLDEPWDSPHNIELSKTAMGAFATPGVEESNKTSIMVFTGDGAPFGGQKATEEGYRGPRMRDIEDGMGWTIAVVNAGPEKAVIWAKPGDLTFNPEDPMSEMGTPPAGGFPAVFFDGHAKRIPADIDPKALAAQITHASADGADVDNGF
jgi:hypothetical protein